MITSDQVRMARAALKWSVAELARRAGVAAKTVIRYENGGNATTESVMKLKVAFDQAGLTWVPENGGPAGVRPPRRPSE
jgi:transcriptional regulator with XRE-family HTH domain